MHNKYTFLFFLILSSINLYGQENNLEEIKRKFRIINTEKREVAFKQLEAIKNDSSFILNLNGLDINQLPNLSKYRNISRIRLNKNELTSIPKYLFTHDSLKSVDLSENKFKKLRLPKNTSVTFLDLSKNEFKRFPRAIRKLKKLKYIDLSNNRIRRIPRFVYKMDSLYEIKLNHSSVKISKRNIKHLKKIKLLQITGNDITTLPEYFL